MNEDDLVWFKLKIKLNHHTIVETCKPVVNLQGVTLSLQHCEIEVVTRTHNGCPLDYKVQRSRLRATDARLDSTRQTTFGATPFIFTFTFVLHVCVHTLWHVEVVLFPPALQRCSPVSSHLQVCAEKTRFTTTTRTCCHLEVIHNLVFRFVTICPF